jgi:hypothetical protein
MRLEIAEAKAKWRELVSEQSQSGTEPGRVLQSAGCGPGGLAVRDRSLSAGCNGMLPLSATLCCTGGIPDALLSCRPVQSNPILPFNSKRSRLLIPAVRGGMATPVGATGSKVRIARYPPGTLEPLLKCEPKDLSEEEFYSIRRVIIGSTINGSHGHAASR